MSASKYGLFQAAGTPKTLDNTLEVLWQSSSMGEWCIRCEACNHWNICAVAHDLLKMLQPHAFSCAKCSTPVNPRPTNHIEPSLRGTGCWVHANPDRLEEFAGYHAPQPIFPMHFADERKWATLIAKLDPAKTPQYTLWNEVLGEACDVGLKLVSQADIQRASTLYGRPNRYQEALAARAQYSTLVMGVDWGGSTAPYGANRAHLMLSPSEATSYTVLAICGKHPSGRIDVLYTYRFSLVNNHVEEAQAIMTAYRDFGCSLFSHDFGGSGAVRETMMVQAGMPIHQIMPILYVHKPTGKLVECKSEQTTKARFYYTVDKARALILATQALKAGQIGLPEYSTSRDVTHDLLALMEDKVSRPGGPDILRIVRQPRSSDDFAHSMTYGCLAIWHTTDYPNLANDVNLLFASAADVESTYDNPEMDSWLEGARNE